MSRDQDDELQIVTAVWHERFGEPPPILTDAALMWRVLDSVSAAAMDKVADLPPFNFM